MTRPTASPAITAVLISAAVVASPAASRDEKFASFPLSFVRQGTEGAIKYAAHGNGYSLSLDPAGAHIVLGADATSVVSLQFEGARNVVPEGEGKLPGTVNYLMGPDSRQWRTGLPTFGRVTYHNLYPNVDAVYYGNQQQLEFDLILRPRADVGQIRLRLNGAKGLSLDKDGALLVRSAEGDLRLPLPAIFQGAEKRRIGGRYAIRGKNEVSFQLENYDRSQTLVIDPSIVWAGYLGGGTNITEATTVAVDALGNTILAGYTSASDFPLVNAAFTLMSGTRAGFVAKIDPTGTTLLYSTFIGGTGSTVLNSLVLDGTGDAWVTGSAGAYFPTTSGAYLTAGSGALFELGPAGNLLYSTYLNSAGQSVAMDPSGNLYIGGTASATFTATAGAFQTSAPGGSDGYVAKFTPSGTLVYATYLGGAGTELVEGIAVDSGGSAYVTGYTTSSTFPGAPGGGAQTAYAGDTDAFVAKLNPSGSALTYFTFLGGSGFDGAKGIAIDSQDYAYVMGVTSSIDFPVTGGVFQPAYGGGGTDLFAVKLSPNGSTLSYATYVGGSREESARALAIDGSGDVYITGYTESANYPIMDPIQGTNPVNLNGISLFQSTNAGTSWNPFDTNISGIVSDVFPDPGTEGVILAVADSGIFRTTNGGAAWTQVLRGDPDAQLNYGNGVLSRSLANSNTLYFLYFTDPLGASPSTIVYQSTDGGATWGSPVTLLPTTALSAGLIVADPSSAGTAYIAANASTVYQTTNGGASWKTISTGLPSAAIVTLVASPDGSIYMGTGGAIVYKSTNQGATWSSVSSGLSGNGIANGLVVAPSNPMVLYWSNGSNTVYTSSNAGGSWTAAAGALPGTANSIAVSPTNAALVYATTTSSSSPYVSTNSGTSWSALTAADLYTNGAPTLVVPDPLSNENLYAVAVPVYETVVVTEINPAGSGLVYSTFLGGSSIGLGIGITTYNGDAIVVGTNAGLFPVTTAAWIGNGQIASEDYGFAARITATTPSCSYSVSPLAETIYSQAQAVVFDVGAPAGCSWTASSGQSFATVAAGASGTGSGFVLVDVSANTTGQNAIATLTIAGQTATLTQTPSSCGYSLNQSSVSVGSAGGPVSVNLTTGVSCLWSVLNEYPLAATLTSASSGTGNTTVNLTIGATAAQGSRTLRFPIGGATLTVTQAGYCTYTLGSSLAGFPAAGGAGTVGITVPTGCAWTASSNQTWLTVTSGASGDTNGTVSFTAAANSGGARSAALTVGGQTLTVSQLGAYLISTIGGGQMPPVSVSGTSAISGTPGGLTMDAAGNLYFGSGGPSAIFRLDPSGAMTLFAGSKYPGYSGDNGLAISAQLYNPAGLAGDSAGNIYIADSSNNVVRMVSAAGVITTVAGNGNASYSGDGGPATSAALNTPWGLAVDSHGNLYISELTNNRVRKVSGGIITTVAGNGTGAYAGDGAQATSAEISGPGGLALDSAGNLYIADSGNNRIREVLTSGIITTVAGNGTAAYAGDGQPATSAEISGPEDVALDSAGNLYIADSGNNRVRMVNTSGVISTVAGNGIAGYSGDGGPATSASLNGPFTVIVDPLGNLYIADLQNARVREVTYGVIQTIVGGSLGDSGPALLSFLNYPTGVAKDSSGNLYIADQNDNRIRKIAPNGTITTVAGTGSKGYSGDNGSATSAQLNLPAGVAVDASGNVYFSDSGNNLVRRISTTGTITTIAGNGTGGGYGGDGGPATSAALTNPQGLAIDSHGNLYISDRGNYRIREVSGGNITTVAGTGTKGYSGDNGPATSAKLSSLWGIAVNGSGNLYFSDGQRIREVSSGTITSIAGTGTAGYSGDNGPATSAEINQPRGVAVDSAGNVYIADYIDSLIRVVATNGIISTIAGGTVGGSGYSNDGGLASTAAVGFPWGIMVDASGNVYETDLGNYILRLLTPVATAPVLTVSSSHTGSFTPGTSAQYAITVTNSSLATATSGSITVTDIVPPALTITSIGAGPGWTCGASSCTLSTPLVAGASDSSITVNVTVAAPAPVQLTNVVTVSGGGAVSVTGGEDLTSIGGAAPVEPAPTSPAPGSTTPGLSVLLTWSSLGTLSSAGGTTYNVYFGTTNPPPFLATTTATSYGITGLNPGATYYWQIQASNGVHTTSTPVQSFVTVSGAAGCEVTMDSPTSVADVQRMLNEVLGSANPINDLTGDGIISVTDIQIVLNAALGGACSLK